MSAAYICRDCGTDHDGNSSARGSFLIEVVLWLCFIVPGLLYSLWRMGSRRRVCRACGSLALLPAGSPAGRKLKADLAVRN